MNKGRVSYEQYCGSGTQHPTKHHLIWRVRSLLQRLKISNNSAQGASALAKGGDKSKGFQGCKLDPASKPHSDCFVLFGVINPKRNSGKVQIDDSNVKFSDPCGYGVIWSICRWQICYLLTSPLCKKKHLFKSLFTFFKGWCQQHI